MKIEFFFTGKTTEKYLQAGVDQYMARLQHYVPASVINIVVPPIKQQGKVQEEEAKAMLTKINPRDLVVLMDENGEMLSSPALASKIQKWMNEGHSKIIFITGSAYGLHPSLKGRANFTLSASRFTFTHQMIRLILTEQVYRAMTILRNESYHHG